MMKDVYIILFVSSIYSLYVQFGPGLGNVWIRKDSNKNYSLSIESLIDLMKESTKNPSMWKLKNLDINYIFFSICGYSICKLVDYGLTKN